MNAMSLRPPVSGIVTFYNQERFVRETLESMLAQDYTPYEVIAVDDGSTDGTREACAAFGDRIRYIHQPNAGMGPARNAGVRRASGAYLAFFDGDDLWSPGRISTQVKAALRHPEVGAIVCDGVEFDDPRLLRRTLYHGLIRVRFRETGARELTLDCHDLFIESNLVQTTSQLMVPAAVFARVGPWHEGIRRSNDYEMLLRITAAGYPITFLSDRLTWYRLVTTSISGRKDLREFTWGLDSFDVYRAHLAHVGPGYRHRIAHRLAELTRRLARAAYYYGHRHDLGWSRRYLIRLAVRSRRPHLVAPYLAAVWVPDRLVREAARLMRSIRSRRPAATDR
jgi:glycosyltransferase involved in cell wall biosynthesis